MSKVILKKQLIWHIDVNEEYETGSRIARDTNEYFGLTIAPRMLTLWITGALADKDYTAALEDYWRRKIPLLEDHYGPFISREDDIDLMYRKTTRDN